MRVLQRVPAVLTCALLILLASSLAGCGAARQYFEPTERVTGQTENGYSQALYPLSGPRGPFGEVTLWSRGAYRTDDDRTVVQVAFSLHNTSDSPIELRGDELRIGTMRTDDALLSELVPADPSVLSVPPQAIGEAQFHFVLPADTKPREVRAFRLRWAVHVRDSGAAPALRGGARSNSVYRQRTVFVELHPRDNYYPPPYAGGYPCWPYGPYDCSFGPPFGAYPTPYPIGYPRYPSIRSERTSVHPDK